MTSGNIVRVKAGPGVYLAVNKGKLYPYDNRRQRWRNLKRFFPHLYRITVLEEMKNEHRAG